MAEVVVIDDEQPPAPHGEVVVMTAEVQLLHGAGAGAAVPQPHGAGAGAAQAGAAGAQQLGAGASQLVLAGLHAFGQRTLAGLQQRL